MLNKLTLMAAGAGCLAACFNLPDFPSSSLVDKPRILAVIADPPEVTPANGTTLSILVGGNKRSISQVRWTVCGMPSSMLGMGNQFGENTGDRSCSGNAIELGQGERVSVPSEVVAAALTNDDLLRAALGTNANLPVAALDEIRKNVGFAATVDVELMVDGKSLGALKRVLVSQNEHPGSNPPPPTFRFGDVVVRSLGEAPPYRCAPDEGVLSAKPGQTIALDPVFDGDVEPWLEDYRVLDARGMLGDRKEQAFYSWFASAGEVDHGMTNAPDRSNSWRAPDKAACAQLWLVVRDGHGGQNACTASVAVGSDTACASE
jgi:hypothetical protein